MMRRFLEIIALAAALVVPTVALAASANSMTDITLAKGETHNGTYYATGSNVTVNGNVNGDVLCSGQTAVINGSVNGDVICAAQNITINGAVSGSVHVAGQSVNINGKVGRNVTVIAQSLTIGSGANVSGDMDIAGQSISIGGSVTGDIYAAAQSLALQSPVSGNVNVRVSNNLDLNNGTAIAGSLTYTSNKTIQVNKNQVKGDVIHNQPPVRPSARATVGNRVGMLIYWILAGLAGTLLAIWLVPRFVGGITEMMLRRPGGSIGWGFVGIIAGPLALLLLTITVIGIPVALFAGSLWLLTLLTSGAIAGVAIGRIILGRKPSDPGNLTLAALVGVPIVGIGVWLPWLGTLVAIATGAWVLGGILLSLNRARLLA